MFFIPYTLYANTQIILDSGERVEGLFIEENDESISIKKYGIVLTYWKDSISQIIKSPEDDFSKNIIPQSTKSYSDHIAFSDFIIRILNRLETDQLSRQMVYTLSYKLFEEINNSLNSIQYNSQELDNVLSKLQELKDSAQNCRALFKELNHSIKFAVNSIARQDLKRLGFISLFSLASIADASMENSIFDSSEIQQLNNMLDPLFMEYFNKTFNYLTDSYYATALKACIEDNPELVSDSDKLFYYNNPQLIKPIRHIKRLLKNTNQESQFKIASHLAKMYFIISIREDIMIIIKNHNKFYIELDNLITKIQDSRYYEN